MGTLPFITTGFAEQSLASAWAVCDTEPRLGPGMKTGGERGTKGTGMQHSLQPRRSFS